MNYHRIDFHQGSIAVDGLRFMPDGAIIINGWSEPAGGAEQAVSLQRDGVEAFADEHYRTFRPDVRLATGSNTSYAGFELVFRRTGSPSPESVVVRHGGTQIAEFTSPVALPPPHYDVLQHTGSVFSREQIYASGPPVAGNTDEVIALALGLSGTVLDFGCGAGYLVSRMRAAGIDAQGVELDRAAIREALLPDVASHVRLTDGTFPLPFADDAFDSAIATEVIEHVDDPDVVVAEIARVVTDRFIVTVPDASAIPALFYANVVPWHLLEATHYHFFNSVSLRSLLHRHFRQIQMMKIGRSTTNGIDWYTSVVAVASGPRRSTDRSLAD